MRHLTTVLALAFLTAFAGPIAAEDEPKPDAPKPDAPKADVPAPEKAKAPREAPARPAPAKAAVGPLTTKWLDPVKWRSIGPANMGGRITSVAVYEADPCVWWAATASGGLLKTENNGTTFEHQFDRERVVSIGDVAVAQSDKNIVWVGTGEANPRNSVSWGDGVYKSVDGGKTWRHMGLRDSFQISSVRIHPTNPDIVYVGALGRLWGSNEERGLFKTTDGGKTWKKIHYVDDKTGVIDVQMSPTDPDTLLVATYERQRDGFDTNDPAKKWGAGSGLYRTTDAGATFTKITKGLPTCTLGRIGLDYYRKDPDVVFMVLESEKIGKEPENAPYMGIRGEDADVGARLTQVSDKTPATKAGLLKGDIVLKLGDQTVHSYAEFVRMARQHVAGDTVKLEVSRERKSVEIELTFGTRPKPKAPAPGARNPAQLRGPRGPFGAFLGGQVANKQDEQGKQGHEFGGVYKSTDGGVSWQRINSVNPRPMYFSEIRVDPSDDQKLFVLGIRLWKSLDGGKTFTPDGHGRGVHVDHHAMWIDPKDSRHVILGNDGGIYVTYDHGANWDHHNHVAIGQFYHVGIGPRRDYRVYGGLQDNGSWGGPSRVAYASGPSNADWMRIGGGDGFRCLVDPEDPEQIYFESQNGAVGRRHLGTGERAGMRPRPARGQQRYRFNWYTPFLLSNHNSQIYYVAGNRVFRSLKKGNKLAAISPDITHTERGSATALAESPFDANVLYVGTDDGALWMTRDGGHEWIDLYQPRAEASDKLTPAAKDRGNIASKDADGNGEPGDDEAPPKPATEANEAEEAEKGDEAEEADEAEEEEESEEEGDVAPAPPSPAERRMERMLSRYKRWDTNEDGKVEAGEVPARAKAMFERLDANKDAVLTEAEVRAFVEQMNAAAAARPRDAATAGDAAEEGEKPGAKPAPSGPGIAELMPDRRWVSWIEASRHKAGRAYVVFDGHRSDDDRSHVYVTEDYGKSWKNLKGNLPDDAGTTRVLREDLKNPNLLYLGTEFGAWASIDRGAHWTSLNTNLPTVAVHAFALHPTSGEIVAGTHGRSLWVLDVTLLRQLKKETLEAEAHLYRPNTAVLWRPQPGKGRGRSFVGQNPTSGAEVYFSLKTKGACSLEVRTLDGKRVQEVATEGEAGLNRVVWDLRRMVKGRDGKLRRGGRVRPGSFKLVLTVGEKTFEQPLDVSIDPASPDPRWITYVEAEEAMEAERAKRKKDRHAPFDGDV